MFDGLGVDSTVHEAAFHSSARVLEFPDAAYDPTTVHPACGRHDTPERPEAMLPVGTTGERTVHFDPFQRSANTAGAPFPPVPLPTATHFLDDEHETALNEYVVDDPEGFGVAWTVQVVPFHRSAKVAVRVAVLSE
jgi:hypothetical protein